MRILLVLLLAATTAVSTDQIADKGLLELVKKIDQKNAQYHSMRAKFIQRKELSLLAEPEILTGTFYLRKPADMRFDFETEDEMSLIVTRSKLVSLSKGKQLASVVPLKERKKDWTQMLLVEELSTIATYFDISRTSSSDGTGPQKLLLQPNNSIARKKVKQLTIWINEDYLIQKVRYVSKDDDVVELELLDIVLNETLDDALFDTTIPEQYQVDDRLTKLLGGGLGL